VEEAADPSALQVAEHQIDLPTVDALEHRAGVGAGRGQEVAELLTQAHRCDDLELAVFVVAPPLIDLPRRQQLVDAEVEVLDQAAALEQPRLGARGDDHVALADRARADPHLGGVGDRRGQQHGGGDEPAGSYASAAWWSPGDHPRANATRSGRSFAACGAAACMLVGPESSCPSCLALPASGPLC